VEAKLRKEPAANEGTCDSNEEVADDPETGTLHDLASQPSGNEADYQYDQQTFTRSKLTNFRSAGDARVPPSKTSVAEASIRFFKEEGITLLRYKAPCQDGDCAKLLTSRGLRISPHADANAAAWGSRQGTRAGSVCRCLRSVAIKLPGRG
jgi:hypothetical protein